MIETVMKFSGAASMVFAAVFYGFIKIRDVRRGICELSAFCELVKYIGDNIEHFMKPIPDIITSYSNAYLDSCGFLPDARMHGLYNAWEASDFILNDEARSLLDEFFLSVGKGYVDDELRLCEYTSKRLCAVLDSVRISAKDKERIYKTIPLMLAASVVLILI